MIMLLHNIPNNLFILLYKKPMDYRGSNLQLPDTCMYLRLSLRLYLLCKNFPGGNVLKQEIQ